MFAVEKHVYVDLLFFFSLLVQSQLIMAIINKIINKYSWMLRHSISAIDCASLDGAV